MILLAGGCRTRPFTVAAAGDLALGARSIEALPRDLLDGELRFCNLEGPLTARGAEAGLAPDGTPMPAAIVKLRAPPARIDALAGRVDVVSLANNHALDQGEAGRDDTVETLAQAHIAAAWRDHPVELERHGRRVQLLARDFAPDADLDAETTLVDETARAARRGPTLVSLHWGHTGSLLPTAAQRRLAARLVDAGALAVLGHGPHTLQGVERRGRAVIAYSLGNLAFDCRCTDVSDAFVLRFTVDGDHVRDVHLQPIDAGLQRPPRRSTDPGLYELLENLSRDLGTHLHRDGADLVLD